MKKCKDSSSSASSKVISDSIGWDGKGFYCRLCGKANYDKMAQVRGHLAMCPGKAIQKGAVKSDSQPVVSSWQPVRTASKANVDGLPTTQPAVAVTPSSNQLEDRIVRLENEYQHMLIEKNTVDCGGSFDLRSDNLRLLIMLGVVGAIFYFIGRENCDCDCSVGGTVRRTKGNSFISSAGTKVFGKLVDKIF